MIMFVFNLATTTTTTVTMITSMQVPLQVQQNVIGEKNSSASVHFTSLIPIRNANTLPRKVQCRIPQMHFGKWFGNKDHAWLSRWLVLVTSSDLHVHQVIGFVLVENGRTMCHHYWPVEDSARFDDFEVNELSWRSNESWANRSSDQSGLWTHLVGRLSGSKFLLEKHPNHGNTHRHSIPFSHLGRIR